MGGVISHFIIHSTYPDNCSCSGQAMRGVFTAHQNPGAVLLLCRGHMGAGDQSCLKEGMKVVSFSRTEKHPQHELFLQALPTVFQPCAGEAACSQDMIWFSLISASIPGHPSFTLRALFSSHLFSYWLYRAVSQGVQAGIISMRQISESSE